MRAITAGIVLVAGLGVTWREPADAQDPEVCGYVRYSTSTGPTTTVPYVPFCERPCGGAGIHVPTTEVQGVHYEALVCVRGI